MMSQVVLDDLHNFRGRPRDHCHTVCVDLDVRVTDSTVNYVRGLDLVGTPSRWTSALRCTFWALSAARMAVE